MDASSLFGGGPSSTAADVDAKPPPAGARADDSPRAAAFLFGGEVEEETTTPSSIGAPVQSGAPPLQSSGVPQVQDMPDDLFGGNSTGGGVQGFGAPSPPPPPPPGAATTGIGGGPLMPPQPRGSAVLPGGPFDGGGGNDEGPSPFSFGDASESSGFGATGDRGDRAAGRQASGAVGAGFGSGGDDLFGAPPASAGVDGFGGPSSGFSSGGAPDADIFSAPPSDLFAGPPPGAATFGFSQGGGGDVFSGPAGGDGGSTPFGGPPRSGAAARSRPDVTVEARRARRDGGGVNTASPFLTPSRSATPPPPISGSYLPPSRSATPPPSTGQYLPPSRSASPPPTGQYLPPSRSATPPPSVGQYLPPSRSATPPPPPPPSSGRGRLSPEPNVFAAPRPGKSLGAPPADMFGAPAATGRASPPSGSAFGAQRSPPGTLGTPPANMFGGTQPPPPPPRSLPPSSAPVGANNPFHTAPPPPPARSLGPRSSPPFPPAQPFGMPPKSGSEWPSQAQPQQSENRSRHGSSSWGTQHSHSAAPAARSPEFRPARKESDSLSRESSAASGPRAWPSTSEAVPLPVPPPPQPPSTVAAELGSPPASMFGDAPRGDFGAPPPVPVPPAPASASSPRSCGSPPLAPFGTTYGGSGDVAWRGEGRAFEPAGNEGSRSAADFFGSPRTEGDIFGGRGGERAVVPLGGAGIRSGANGSSPGSSKGAAVAVPSVGAWPEEQQCGPSGIGAPLGSPTVEGAFGTGGGTDGGSSPWWQTGAGNDNQSSMQVEPSEMSRDDILMSADFSGSVTAVKTLDSREDAPSPSPLAHSAAYQIDDTLSLPPSGRPAQELGAPPSDLFGPPPGTRGVESEESLPQRQVPLARPPRSQSPQQEFTTMEDDFAVPAAASAPPPQPVPGGVDASLDDSREASWAAAVGAEPAGSGVVPEWSDAAQADGRTQQSVSPGWEKQPSPPLDLGVFGAAPPPGEKAVVGGQGLFGEAAGDDFTKDSGGYDGWGMCPADEDNTAELNEPRASTDRSEAGRSEDQDIVAELTEPGASTGRIEEDADQGEVAEMTEPRASAASEEEQGGEEQRGEGEEVAPKASTPPTGRETPPSMFVPRVKPSSRSSFVASKASSAETISFAGISLDDAPSSPPRLFAARSSSWAEGEMSTHEKSDYHDIFASSTDAKRASALGFSTEAPVLSEEGEGWESGKQEGDEEGEAVAEVAAVVTPEADRVAPALPESLPVATERVDASSPFADDDALLQGDGGGASTISAQGDQAPLGGQPALGGQPPQEGQSSLGADSEASSAAGPAGLHDRAVDEAETLPATEGAQRGDAGGGKGESDAAQESGDRLGIGSSLSTPFGAWSPGSGTRAGEAEGFPSAEIGDVLRGPPSERPSSPGKKVSAEEPSSLSGVSRTVNEFPAIIASFERPLSVGEEPVGAGQRQDGAGVSEASAVEGKEDERPRWDTPPAAVGAGVGAAAAVAAIPPAVMQAEKKLDVDSGDWKEAGSVSDADGQEDKAEGRGGGDVVVPAEDERADDVEGAGKGLQDREIGASLFSSESSNETRGDGGQFLGEGGVGQDEGKQDRVGGEEEVGRGVDQEEGEEGGEDESEGSNGIEASVAETTASDFFAVRESDNSCCVFPD